MNLAMLERMVREGDCSVDAMRFLLKCRAECEWLDYKKTLNLDDDRDICCFSRDVLGMKNVGGGYIVVGVEDKTWKPVGLSANLPYDKKMLTDKIRKATGTDLDVDIVHHELHSPEFQGVFALIFVRSSKKPSKRKTPTLVKHDFCAQQKYGLRTGEIYFRKGDSTVKLSTAEELVDLEDNLSAQVNQGILDSRQPAIPFAILDGTYRLLEKGFEQFVGRTQLRREIHDAVLRDPRIWIINVHGVGGVGKSALVNWVSHQFYEERKFEAILQLTAKETALSPSGISRATRSLYSLENLLDSVLSLFEETPPQDLEDKKTMATEYLSAWSTLLVLDNMETVDDSRILTFISSLPPNSKAKVLMTSRQRTGTWEFPIQVSEFNTSETEEFLRQKSVEFGVNCRCDTRTVSQVWQASGGLPLAIQWILGKSKLTGSMEKSISDVDSRDSPVLEFSFGNIWRALSADAKAVLAVMSIFETPPTIQQMVIATEFQTDRVEKAVHELCDVTLTYRSLQPSDGRTLYVCLPITLSFARSQLQGMGDFEVACRRRFAKFCEQMSLQEKEMHNFSSRFEQYGLSSDNEKRAAILCQRGESQWFSGDVDSADMLFKQARDLSPQSSYVLAMCASYELARGQIGVAVTYVDDACRRANKKTGVLCFTIKARIMEVQGKHAERFQALEKALEYQPDNNAARHQYGVALSKANRTQDAINEFSKIIDSEASKTPPSMTLLVSLKTRMINYRRMNRTEEFLRDLRWSEEILSQYPHLSSEAHQFAEFYE